MRVDWTRSRLVRSGAVALIMSMTNLRASAQAASTLADTATCD